MFERALRKLRKELGFNLYDVGACLDVSYNTVKKWEQNGVPSEQVFRITSLLGYDNQGWIEEVNKTYGINIRYRNSMSFDDYEVNSVIYPDLVTKDPFAPETLVLLIIQRAKDGFYTKNNEKRKRYIDSFIDEGRVGRDVAEVIKDNKNLLPGYDLLTAFVDIASHQRYETYEVFSKTYGSYKKDLKYQDNVEEHDTFSNDNAYFTLIMNHIKNIKTDDEKDLFTEKIFIAWMSNDTVPIEMLNKMFHYALGYTDDSDYRRAGLYLQLVERIRYIMAFRCDNQKKRRDEIERMAEKKF